MSDKTRLIVCVCALVVFSLAAALWFDPYEAIGRLEQRPTETPAWRI